MAKNDYRTMSCGCVFCICEDEERCHGCGAKNCGDYPSCKDQRTQEDLNKKQELLKGEPFKRDRTLNIHQRINMVMSEIDYIKKDKGIKKSGTEFVLYNVTGHDAVTKMVHPLFVKYGINLIPSGETMIQEGNRTRIEIVFGWFNIDDPKDCIQQKWFGYGIDAQDKGPGKAISYAQRYVVLKTLHIETGDKDLEDDDIDFKETKKEAGENGDIPLTNASGQNISKGAVVALEKLFTKHKKEQKPILDQFQVDSVEEILIKDYGAVKDLITA